MKKSGQRPAARSKKETQVLKTESFRYQPREAPTPPRRGQRDPHEEEDDEDQ